MNNTKTMTKDKKKNMLKNMVKGKAGMGKEHMMPGGEMMKDKDMPMNKYKNLKKK